MVKLKQCPFCGEPGELRRVLTGCGGVPTSISDRWTVECPNGCCQIKSFESDIYQDENGDVVVRQNGAEEAIAAWNKRV